MLRVRIVASLALLGLGAHPVLAQSHPLQPTAVIGEWAGPLQMDAGVRQLSLDVHLTDSTVTGTVYLDGDSFGAMENGRVRGDTVHFNLDRLDFTGVITGSRMNVALIVYNGSTRHLTLTRQAAPGGERSP